MKKKNNFFLRVYNNCEWTKLGVQCVCCCL